MRRPFVLGVATGAALLLLAHGGNAASSTDAFCASCHVHPQAISSWRQSTHYATKSGTVVHCIECHLPPGGVAYGVQKTRLGVRDAWGAVFGTQDSTYWEIRSQLEHAVTHVFEASCLDCHPNLYPVELSDKGEEAHLHYEEHADEVPCIKCHLHVGHYDPDAEEFEFGLAESSAGEIHEAHAVVEGFVDYTEFIPGTSVAFDMVTIPGGTFVMGSPPSEPYRREDEGPTHEVTLSAFWMGRAEVSWNEFEAWYAATHSEGRTDTQIMEEENVDALTGATPPYVPPDQGWGKGDRPAITMTPFAAEQYCRWLSEVTGRHYRLPTEAEWEYAARAGSVTPYFFAGDPSDYPRRRFWNRLFGRNTTTLDSFAIHAGNSGGRTQPPTSVAPNAFGLVHMLGNVREFTADWYRSDAYQTEAGVGPVIDLHGPPSGSERVVRGGSFRSDPVDLRAAARDHTRTDACLVSDPQSPKSRWWYSDCADIGFRVVRDFDDADAVQRGGGNHE